MSIFCLTNPDNYCNTLLANPEITSISASPVVVPALSPLTLSCSASPATSLTWYLNSTRLAPDLDSNLFIQQDGTLVVSSANISYTGTYTCNVSTSFTFVVSQVEVVVGGELIMLSTSAIIDSCSIVIARNLYKLYIQDWSQLILECIS